jgi:hypothetical protein
MLAFTYRLFALLPLARRPFTCKTLMSIMVLAWYDPTSQPENDLEI